MLSVYLVDGTTRLVLPSTAWSQSVRESLAHKGHTVVLTDEDPDAIVRSKAELEHRDFLLSQAA